MQAEVLACKMQRTGWFVSAIQRLAAWWRTMTTRFRDQSKPGGLWQRAGLSLLKLEQQCAGLKAYNN
jgi:hypothetical protein